MSFDLTKIFSEMSGFALIVAGGLVVFALASIAVFFERLWVYWRAKKKSLAFAAVATRHLMNDDYAALERAAAAEKGNYLASLLGAGVRAYQKAAATPSQDVGAVELARRAVERHADVIAARLRRGMGVLSSVGSVAPFVGLLGTVVGIIDAFQGIAASGSGGLGAVSAGIAEALVVTALGLLVAIPAVLAFNFLSARADALELAIDQSRGEFIDHIEAGHSSTASLVDMPRSERASAA
jgi:biopolymer transport protein ExbB